ncbi:MAG: protoporphyrinogen oxidase [Gemmatimonadota bacterium]|nr:protoporphyrinogen oxidase [Gemmatimonadota bacterium]MDH5197860.1 protoporphyrinogen oxidase [Gemmatimonadota bacterium]
MKATVRVAVVGGGITGLAAAHRLTTTLRSDDLLLLEADGRLGGKITTERTSGYVIEGGPDCFLGIKPAGIELCRRLGIADRIRGTNPQLRRSFVKRAGQLHELPDGLTGLVPSRIGPLMTTGILSRYGRLRAACEPLVPRRTAQTDEAIASFVIRRFGREAYDWLVEPLLSGIFAGDGAALSLGATFPQLAATERLHGSVLLPMLRARFRKNGTSGPPPLGFVTPETGLAELVEALERVLPGPQVWRGARVAELIRLPHGWRLALEDGRTVDTLAVVMTAPAFATAELVAPLDPTLGETLAGIPFVSTATVSVAFPRSAVPQPLNGSGYVSPRMEGGSVVACTWTSNKFPARVPADGVLLRFFLGRAGSEGPAFATDDEIQDMIRAELAAVHGITAEPDLWKVYRWPRGLPQYTVGHLDRLALIDRRLAALPGLVLAGASYGGVGIPDCIKSGWSAADAAAAHVETLVAA